MERVIDALTSPLALELIGLVIAAVWALPRLQNWREQVRKSVLSQAYTMALGAATTTWQTYVRAVKAASEDGHLLPGQKEVAFRTAWSHFHHQLAADLPQVWRHYSNYALEAILESAVNTLKQKGGALSVADLAGEGRPAADKDTQGNLENDNETEGI